MPAGKIRVCNHANKSTLLALTLLLYTNNYDASNKKDMFLYLSRTIAIIVFVGVVNNTIAGHGIEVNQSAP